jgi:hypothetical protein
MIILLESNQPQKISFIPLRSGAISLQIRNESTEEIQTITPSFTIDKYYTTCTTTFTLKQNHFYNLKVIGANDEIIYLDKIFCTNQNTDSYTINKDTYVVSENNTIFYE